MHLFHQTHTIILLECQKLMTDTLQYTFYLRLNEVYSERIADYLLCIYWKQCTHQNIYFYSNKQALIEQKARKAFYDCHEVHEHRSTAVDSLFCEQFSLRVSASHLIYFCCNLSEASNFIFLKGTVQTELCVQISTFIPFLGQKIHELKASLFSQVVKNPRYIR